LISQLFDVKLVSIFTHRQKEKPGLLSLLHHGQSSQHSTSCCDFNQILLAAEMKCVKCICKVQEISGSAHDTLECPERLYYHSKIIEGRTSTGKCCCLWLDNFRRRYSNSGKVLKF